MHSFCTVHQFDSKELDVSIESFRFEGSCMIWSTCTRYLLLLLNFWNLKLKDWCVPYEATGQHQSQKRRIIAIEMGSIWVSLELNYLNIWIRLKFKTWILGLCIYVLYYIIWWAATSGDYFPQKYDRIEWIIWNKYIPINSSWHNWAIELGGNTVVRFIVARCYFHQCENWKEW